MLYSGLQWRYGRERGNETENPKTGKQEEKKINGSVVCD